MSWFPADMCRNSVVKYFTGFPLGQKNLEKWDSFSSQGKVKEFLTDSKSQGRVRILESQGILPVSKSVNHVLGAIVIRGFRKMSTWHILSVLTHVNYLNNFPHNSSKIIIRIAQEIRDTMLIYVEFMNLNL